MLGLGTVLPGGELSGRFCVSHWFFQGFHDVTTCCDDASGSKSLNFHCFSKVFSFAGIPAKLRRPFSIGFIRFSDLAACCDMSGLSESSIFHWFSYLLKRKFI